MKIIETLKTEAIKKLAKMEMPNSLERGLLADRIADRLVPYGHVLKLDYDSAERFARSCIDETIAALEKHIEKELGKRERK